MKEMKGALRILGVGVVLALVVLTGCSSDSSSDKSAEAESIYDPGASVPAVSYAEACGVELFLKSPGGALEPVSDGDAINPGVHTLAVKIEGDPSSIDRVFLTNGGLYQVEAVSENSLYVCDYEVSGERLYESVLIQVIHSSGRATKEKVVFKTFESCPPGTFPEYGIGVSLGREIMDAHLMELELALDDMIGEVFSAIASSETGLITTLAYRAEDGVRIHTLEPAGSALYPDAVLRLVFTIPGVTLQALPLFGNNLVQTADNDLVVDLYAGLADLDEEGRRRLVLTFFDSARLTFAREFFLRAALEELLSRELTSIAAPAVSMDLGELLAEFKEKLPTEAIVNDEPVDVGILFENLNLDLDKYLFVNLSGMSGAFTMDSLVLSAGFYAAETDEVDWPDAFTPPSPLEPGLEELFIEMCTALTDEVFEAVKTEDGVVIIEDGIPVKIRIETLSYGDNDPATDDFVVNSLILGDAGEAGVKTVRISFTVKDVDLRAVSYYAGLPLVNTSDNDLTIEADLEMRHIPARPGLGQVEAAMVEVRDVRFSETFSCDLLLPVRKTATEELITRELQDLDDLVLDLEEILGELELEVDLSSFLVSGTAPEFPDVSPCLPAPSWDLALQDGFTLRAAVSSSTINWLCAALVGEGFSWDVREVLGAILGDDFEGFTAGRADDEETILRLSAPPVLDVRTNRARIIVDDLILEYRLAGVPQWEASLDLDLLVEVKSFSGRIDVYVSPVTEHCRFHIMRDNPGNLGVFDHSGLVSDIIIDLPEMLGGSPGGPLFSVGLDALEPSVVLEHTTTPVQISSGEGSLYVDAAVAGVDLSWILDLFLRDLFRQPAGEQ